MQGIKLILNEQIETNMDIIANIMNAMENVRNINILSKSAAGYLLKSWGLSSESNQKMEGQLKLFRTQKNRALK